MELTEKLSEVMRGHNMFDTDEGQRHRLYVLGKLNELMKRWIVGVSVEKVREATEKGSRVVICVI